MAGPGTGTISLAGTWRFRLDPKKVGVEQQWYATRLPEEIKLPGTTDEAKLGLPNPAKPSLDGLYRPNVYAGPAWYQRDIEIPADWQGKHVELLLERVHWETHVWLDGREIGTRDSLIAPQVHDLGIGITPGKHSLTIRVDNSLKFDLGGFVSILYEGTQTNWNGIVGRIELGAVEPLAIKDVQVYPDVDQKRIRVVLAIENNHGGKVDCGALFTVTNRQTGKFFVQHADILSQFRSVIFNTYVTMDHNFKFWDEFSPNLYELKVQLRGPGPSGASERKITFGMRKLGIRGTQFVLNGRPIFLRGTLECAIFPLTGYPPTDVPAWQRIFRVLKSYGLNFMRFHSWCPPEAAFAAADIEGVYLQVEGPEANISIDRHAPIGRFMEQELLCMVRTYGNHPSFCLMTLGNEHSGVGDTLDYWVQMLIREDPRHFYSSASAGQMTAHRQYTEGGPRGVNGPRTETDFRGEVSRQDRPLMGHEIGQWTFFPNFDEIAKYTGVLQAKNFELVRDDLAKKHLLDLAPQFVQATGRHAVLLYKEEIEVLLRTPNYPGFSLLDLHDYPGQGTALIGPLDPFWDSKGFVTPEQHTRYCGPSVPLLRLKKRTFTSDESLTAEAEIAHFGPRDLVAVMPQWIIRDEKGSIVADDTLPPRDIPTGKLTPLGKIEASLANASAPAKLTISLSLPGTPIANQWEIWVYPPKVNLDPPKGLIVSKVWDDEVKSTLANGGRVLLFAAANSSQSLPGRFLPVFWSPIWFPTQKPNTMGILCDPKHSALADFPTDFYSNWQWYELLDHSRSIILDDTPAEFRPVVSVIDNFARNHKLGVISEARVGSGRLLVCGIDLPGLVEKQPAARQLLMSLQRYAGSEAFQPRSELSAETLDKLFAPALGGLMQRLGAKVISSDSQVPDYEAANVIDGDPQTIWHTPWDDQPPVFPHDLVIEFATPVAVGGLKVLPRQDMPNGRIADYEVFVSNDGKSWGSAVKRGKFANSGEVQVVEFGRRVKVKYLKFVALSSFEKKPYASMAELEVIPAGSGK
ncbi:MAG: discoidin domain-containing protein [Thermoguttaceae bacterium]